MKSDLAHDPVGLEAHLRYEPERRAAPGFPCSFPARIADSDRAISTSGRIVAISNDGAKVEVMFPIKGPSVIMLFHCRNDQIYECEVRWRTDAFIGVRFLDILGSGRRRLFFADRPVPLRWLPNEIIRLNEPPRDDGFSILFDPIWRAGEDEPVSLRGSRASRSTKAPSRLRR